MRIRIWMVALSAVLSVVLLPLSSTAQPARRKPLPTKSQWYAQVHRTMKPAFPYLRHRVASGANNLAINLDIDNVSLATFYDHKAPIPDTLRLARKARRNGVSVFFNTGRNPRKLAEVIPRLEAAGFQATGYCGRQDDEKLVDSKQRCRQTITNLGYRIIINVGNNTTDFVGSNYELRIALPNYRKRLS